MVYSLSYRRPAYVSSASSLSQESIDSKSTTCPAGIPDALSFNKIISGGACPPCSLRDFMNYLLYIEFAAENLQFYLWFKDYVKRFDNLPESEKALATAVDTEKQDVEFGKVKSPRVKVVAAFGESPFTDKKHGFDESPQTEKDVAWSDTSTVSSAAKDHRVTTAKAFESVDVSVQPFTIQPYREEISKIIATYISDGSARQLNLSSKERAELLRNLAVTTHPSAFVPILKTVEWTLKHQAHPNFIRWTISNSNKPRCIFARVLGFSHVLIGLVILCILSASGFNRAWRIFAGIPFCLGVSAMFAGWKGMCIVLHGMHHRNLRPWELFSDDDEAVSEFEKGRKSWDSFGTRNSYEDEPWVAKYKKRNIVRKVFECEVWVQEPALRQIQDTIFIQSLLLGLGSTIVVVGAFCAIPPGHQF